MRCLSLHNPWASLIAVGAKSLETRSWQTPYRGELALHAAKTTASLDRLRDLYAEAFPDGDGPVAVDEVEVHALETLGCVVAVADLVDCFECGEWVAVPSGDPSARVARGYGYVATAADFVLGDLSPGRLAWVLRNVRPLKQAVPVRAYQAVFTLPPKVASAVYAAMWVPVP